MLHVIYGYASTNGISKRNYNQEVKIQKLSS